MRIPKKELRGMRTSYISVRDYENANVGNPVWVNSTEDNISKFGKVTEDSIILSIPYRDSVIVCGAWNPYTGEILSVKDPVSGMYIYMPWVPEPGEEDGELNLIPGVYPIVVVSKIQPQDYPDLEHMLKPHTLWVIDMIFNKKDLYFKSDPGALGEDDIILALGKRIWSDPEDVASIYHDTSDRSISRRIYAENDRGEIEEKNLYIYRPANGDFKMDIIRFIPDLYRFVHNDRDEVFPELNKLGLVRTDQGIYYREQGILLEKVCDTADFLGEITAPGDEMVFTYRGRRVTFLPSRVTKLEQGPYVTFYAVDPGTQRVASYRARKLEYIATGKKDEYFIEKVKSKL